MTHIIGRRAARMLSAALLALLLGGVAADCSGEGGMYQGGSDSVPGWRK